MNMNKLRIVVAILSIATLSLGSTACSVVEGKSAKETMVNEETVAIEKMDLDQSITMSGTVQSGTVYSVTSTIVDTEIKTVNVKEGDRVQKGQVIAILDDTQLKTAQDSARKSLSNIKRKNNQDISSAKRNLKNAQQDKKTNISRADRELKEATRQYNNAVNEKAKVNAEYVNVQSELQSKQKEYEEAKTIANEAKKNINAAEQELNKATEKAEELQEKLNGLKGAEEETENIEAVQKAYDEQLKILTAKQTHYDALKAQIDKEASLLEAVSTAKEKEKDYADKVKSAEEAVYTAKSTLEKASDDKQDAKTAGSRSVQEQQSALEGTKISAGDSLTEPTQELKKVQSDLDKCIVKAESDGIVTSVNVKPGDVYKGEAIAVIQNDNGYSVTANVDQYDISSLANGQKAKITVAAAEMENTAGKLIHVAKTPTVTTGEDGSVLTGTNYKVEARIDEPSSKLMIGMTAKIVVTVWEKKNVLAVPDICIQTDENGEKYIETVNEKGKHKNITVKYGMKSDYYSEIISDDIEEGMNVIMPAESQGDEEELE